MSPEKREALIQFVADTWTEINWTAREFQRWCANNECAYLSSSEMQDVLVSAGRLWRGEEDPRMPPAPAVPYDFSQPDGLG